MHFPFPHIDEETQINSLMKELAHIYHYYIHSMEPLTSFENQDKKNVKDKSNKKDSTTTESKRSKSPKNDDEDGNNSGINPHSLCGWV